MKNSLSDAWLKRTANILWGFVLFTLPVTTFPLIPGPLGRTTIKPLALYPLAILFPILIFLMLRHKSMRLPSNSPLLLAFILFAIISSLIGFLFAPLELRGVTYGDRSLRAWISLSIGMVFFLSAYWMNRSQVDLRRNLKWLFAGLTVTLIWSLIQALAVNTDLLARSTVDKIQLLFSERGVQPRRVTGFAFEPAWLADQLVIFFMPWLFATFVIRYRIFKRNWTVAIFFIVSLAILLFTYSRGGLLAMAISIMIVSLILGRDSLRALGQWIMAPFRGQVKSREGTRKALALRFGLLLLVGFILLGSFGFLSQYDYFANIWNTNRDQSLTNYLIQINSAPRAAYALAGYRVYEQYPLTGVGLGASGLYLFEHLPDWSLGIAEIARQLSPESKLILNPKNLYVRLLAELGLPGFWLFLAFLLSFLSNLRRQWASSETWLRYVATAGLFAWVGIMVRNLTQDSFTFPIMWVALGMIAGFSPTKK